MKYLITVAVIMWGAFFYTNAKAHSIEEAKEEGKQLIIQEQINDMTLEIITVILQNLPIILESIENHGISKALNWLMGNATNEYFLFIG